MTELSLRVVVDTNVLLSFLMKRSSTPGKLLTHIFQHHQLLVSSATLEELMDKCSREKFRPYFSQEEGQAFVSLLQQLAERVVVNLVITDCRDAKDNKFLELMIAGNADLLVTGDKDLLVLHPYQGIPVLNAHDSSLYLEVAL